MSGFVAASHRWKMSWWLVNNIQWCHAKKCWNTLLNTGLWLGLKIPGFLLQTTTTSRQKYVVLSPHTAGNCPVQWFHVWKYSILNNGLSRGSKTCLVFWCKSSHLIKHICCCCNPAENVSWLAISSGFTFGKCWNTILNSGLSRGSKTYLVFWCKPSRLIKQYVLISNIQWFQAQKMLKHCLEQWSLAVICQNILDVFNETWEM